MYRKQSNSDFSIVIPTLTLSAVIAGTLIFFPDTARRIISMLYSMVVGQFGWMYILACLTSFAFLGWVTFSKFGDITFGKRGEKPVYSNFAWAGMLFTSGVGSSAVILGFVEPLYYLKDPALSIEPFSELAYEYAHMYGQFHWGLSAWAFYIPAITAIGLIVFKDNEHLLRLSVVNNHLHPGSISRFLGKCIDVLVMFAILAGISTSLGLAVPVVSNLISGLFRIPNTLPLQIVILMIWISIFTFSVFRGLDRGIKLLSDINVVLLILFGSVLLILGPTIDILKMEVNSIGLYLQDFVRINTWLDPFGSGEFQEMWTIFYWGWWLTFMPLMALFIVRTSRGRTLRSVVWQQMLWGTLGCWFCFGIFGGFTLHLQQTGTVDYAAMLETQGQEAVVVSLLRAMPLAPLMILLFCLLVFIFLATTIDSAAYILASSSAKTLSVDSQPSRPMRIFWAGVLAVLSIGLLVINELKAVQTISLIAGLPMIFVQFYMVFAGYKLVKRFGAPAAQKRDRAREMAE
ncbi:BCCT family transporter [Anaerotruncus sp. G3(2012)]|uniref:BCCT family transporter n=1 Tax=Anaerotruncus sp. G3(2012) TaxID=1235835 RepID=UPI00039FB599|nr:BCCT family transporter [Anaerotruncus sp. G3(2012)]